METKEQELDYIKNQRDTLIKIVNAIKYSSKMRIPVILIPIKKAVKKLNKNIIFNEFFLLK